VLTGATRCEACGELRARTDATLLTHPDHPISFFGAAWTGGVIAPGDRVAFDARWLAEDVDRGMYFRARHPVGETLTLLGQRRRVGCRCGAGRGYTVARFARRAGTLELETLGLRALRRRSELADIDFIEGCARSWGLFPSAPPRSRERVIDELGLEP
jgi:hypothetical protein